MTAIEAAFRRSRMRSLDHNHAIAIRRTSRAHWWGGMILATWSLAAACADERVQLLKLDSARSYVDFEVKVLWLVGVHGRFGSVHGTIAVDRFRNTATVDARIDASVIAMRSKSHEEWVKSAEFFDAQHYPEIQFVSESIPLKRLQDGGEIEGVLTLRGVKQRVQFQLIEPTCLAMTGENCPVEAQGSIRRSDFGMSSRRGTLSDKVELSFSIYATPMQGDLNK